MGLLSGILDVPGWFKSDKPEVPGYTQNLGQQSADTAAQANAMSMGGVVIGNDGVRRIIGPSYTNGQSVPELLGHPAAQLINPADPNQNSWLTAAQQAAAQQAAAGGANAGAGAAMAQGGLVGAAGAAGAIGAAGQDTRMFQGAQLGAQMGQAQQGNNDLNVVRNTANGTGPSAAENLARAQVMQNQQAMASQAAMARGGNIASAMRSATQAGGQMALNSVPQIQAQRAQEQLNGQSVLTQGNAAVGQQQAAIGTNLSNIRGGDTTQAVGSANAMNDVAKSAVANYGVGAQQQASGGAALTNTANQYGNQMVQSEQLDQNARQAYASWLQQQYAISAGVPIQVGGLTNQIGIANQQNSTQQQGAALGLVGSLLTSGAAGGGAAAAV